MKQCMSSQDMGWMDGWQLRFTHSSGAQFKHVQFIYWPVIYVKVELKIHCKYGFDF